MHHSNNKISQKRTRVQDQQGRSLERGVYLYRLEIEKPMGKQEILVGDLNVL